MPALLVRWTNVTNLSVLRLVVRAWRVVVLQYRMEAQKAELERLQEKEGLRANSIWNMNKAELVAVAMHDGSGQEIALAQPNY